MFDQNMAAIQSIAKKGLKPDGVVNYHCYKFSHHPTKSKSFTRIHDDIDDPVANNVDSPEAKAESSGERQCIEQCFVELMTLALTL